LLATRLLLNVSANTLHHLYKPVVTILCNQNLFRLRSMFLWVALRVSHLANIWSRMRRIFWNHVDCRNIRPNMKFSEIGNSSASEKEDVKRCISELDDVKQEPLRCLITNSKCLMKCVPSVQL
jgi:hypothetical protein